MSAQSLNLASWVRRLGFKRTDAPPALFALQPVVLSGDYSHLVSPAREARAIHGGLSAGVVGQHAFVSILCQRPCLVRAVVTRASGSPEVVLVESPTFDTGPTTASSVEVAPPVTALVQVGAQIAAPTGPSYGAGGTFTDYIMLPVPAGVRWALMLNQAATALHAWMDVQELPSDSGE